MEYPNALFDAMECCSRKFANTPEHINYGKGVLVGIISALMFTGCNFVTALNIAFQKKPRDFNMNCLPESYVKVWQSFKN